VEQPSDLAVLEKSGAFRGLYHVLHGTISPINGVGPDDLKIKELVSRVAGGNIREVIIATNTSVEGEATASYICQLLQPYPVTVTRIASGVPMGSDLKYLDEGTIRCALERRQDLHSA
jgi:recombination protein RecR